MKSQLIKLKQSGFLPLAIVIAGVLIAGAVLYSSGREDSAVLPPPEPDRQNVAQTTGAPSPTSAVNIANVDTKGEPFIGNPKAPVTLAYWFDFQCPFCQRFESQTLPTLIKDYVKTNKLKVVFKDFQFLGPDSQDAGLVAHAVWDLYPGTYFKWQEAVLAAQDGENSGFGNLKSILDLTREKFPKIDADKVAAQVEKKRDAYQKEQAADKAEGERFGVKGTPGFVIGTQTISGAQPASVFATIIDAQLKKARQ